PPTLPGPPPPVDPSLRAPTAVVPPEPVVIAPPAPTPPPPPPPKPAIRRGIVPTYKEEIVFPRAAIRAGIEKGSVVARVMIDEKGNVSDVIIVSADPPRHFDRAVIDALKAWKFQADGEKYIGEIEVNFKLGS